MATSGHLFASMLVQKYLFPIQFFNVVLFHCHSGRCCLGSEASAVAKHSFANVMALPNAIAKKHYQECGDLLDLVRPWNARFLSNRKTEPESRTNCVPFSGNVPELAIS